MHLPSNLRMYCLFDVYTAAALVRRTWRGCCYFRKWKGTFLSKIITINANPIVQPLIQFFSELGAASSEEEESALCWPCSKCCCHWRNCCCRNEAHHQPVQSGPGVQRSPELTKQYLSLCFHFIYLFHSKWQQQKNTEINNKLKQCSLNESLYELSILVWTNCAVRKRNIFFIKSVTVIAV